MLVCADGSTSRLATQLGYCTAPPQGVSSRAYIEGGTHNANFDGLVFYPRWSLPGCVCSRARACVRAYVHMCEWAVLPRLARLPDSLTRGLHPHACCQPSTRQLPVSRNLPVA